MAKVTRRLASRLEGLDAAVRLRRQRYRASDPDRALGALRRHAVERSALYRELHAGLAEAPLDQLPILTKDVLIDRFDEAVTDPEITQEGITAFVAEQSPDDRYLGRYRVGMTSGTSGRPGILPFAKDEWLAFLTSAITAHEIARPSAPVGPRSAKLGSPWPWHMSSQVGATVRDPRRPSLRIPCTAPVEHLVEELNRFRPDRLTAYPSVLEVLAVEQLEGRLRIDPAHVLTSGEVLTAATREVAGSAWGVGVHDLYVCTESSFVAAQCTVGEGLHVLDDHVVVEVVDRDGELVPAGETGERVLLTVLSSRTVPLIRFELHDAVRVLPEPCPCGRVSPRVVVDGRLDTLITFTTPGGEVLVHPVVFDGVMDGLRVLRWQVRHRDDGIRVLVAGAPDDLDETAIRTGVAGALRDAGVEREMPVTVERVADIERTPSGKLQRVVPDR